MLDTTLLKEYINQEFLFRGKSINLNETRGIVPGLEQIVQTIADRFVELYTNNKIDWIKPLYITQKIFRKNSKPIFFNRLRIKIIFVNNGDDDIGDYALNTKTLDEDNKLKILNITLKLQKTNLPALTKSLKSMLAHELTHAWEDHQRKLKGEETLYTHIDKNEYTKTNFENGDNETVRLLKSIAYELFDTERHAYVGTTYRQLHPYKQEIKAIRNSKDTVKDYDSIIRKTDVYGRIERLGNYITYLKGIQDPEKQRKILELWNCFTKLKFKTYNNLLNKLTYMWNRYISKYFTIASKAIYDIRCESTNKILLTCPRQLPTIEELTKEI